MTPADPNDAEFAEGDRLRSIELADTDVAPTPELENDRKVAIFDLTEENRFRLDDASGPYDLRLALIERKIVFDLVADGADAPRRVALSAGPLQRAAIDYLAICDSYQDAVRRLPPSQIEAIDASRREAHAEASELLRERLAPQATVDAATAKRLFTLICTLLPKG